VGRHVAVIVAGRIFIAGGDENGDALGDGGLVEVVDVKVLGGSVGLGVAVADADDGGRIGGLKQVGQGEETAELGGIGAGRVHDGRVGSGCRGPLDVDGCFNVVSGALSRAADFAHPGVPAGVCACRVGLREGGVGIGAAETENLAEGGPVAHAVLIGVFDQDDGLPLAGDARLEEGIEVVDGSQIGGAE
jgi:hypothetical protein